MDGFVAEAGAANERRTAPTWDGLLADPARSSISSASVSGSVAEVGAANEHRPAPSRGKSFAGIEATEGFNTTSSTNMAVMEKSQQHTLWWEGHWTPDVDSGFVNLGYDDLVYSSDCVFYPENFRMGPFSEEWAGIVEPQDNQDNLQPE